MTLWDKREALLIQHLEKYLVSSVRYAVIRRVKNRFDAPASLDELGHAPATHTHETEECLLLADLRTALDTALTALPHKTQTVFRLSRFDQFSHAEIADQLQFTEKAVEYHINQALRQLRVSLREFLG